MRHAEKGFTLFEVMLMLAISTIVIYSITYSNAVLIKLGTMLTAKEQFSLIQSNIAGFVQNNASWTATKNANIATGPYLNGQMDCIVNSTPCTNNGQPVTAGGVPLAQIGFALMDGVSATAYYDGTNAASGVSTYGLFCNTYTTTAPTDNCVFRYQLVWSAMCSATNNPNCINPQVKVEAIFIYNANSPLGIVLNTGQFSITGATAIYR